MRTDVFRGHREKSCAAAACVRVSTQSAPQLRGAPLLLETKPVAVTLPLARPVSRWVRYA